MCFCLDGVRRQREEEEVCEKNSMMGPSRESRLMFLFSFLMVAQSLLFLLAAVAKLLNRPKCECEVNDAIR